MFGETARLEPKTLGHVREAGGILGARREPDAVDLGAHVGDDVVDPPDRIDGLAGRGLGRGDLPDDVLGCRRRLAGELLDLVGDDGEPSSGLACAARLDRRVEREEVRLGGDRGDERDGLLDLGRRALQALDDLEGPVDLDDGHLGRAPEGAGRGAQLGRGGGDLRRDLVNGVGDLDPAPSVPLDDGGGVGHPLAGVVDRRRAVCERAGHAADEKLPVVAPGARGGERGGRLPDERVGDVDEVVESLADLGHLGRPVESGNARLEVAGRDPSGRVGERREGLAICRELVGPDVDRGCVPRPSQSHRATPARTPARPGRDAAYPLVVGPEATGADPLPRFQTNSS